VSALRASVVTVALAGRYPAVVSIAENIAVLRARIAAAARRAGRDPAEVTLIGASSASKGVTTAAVVAAIEAGLTDFGENYVQEIEPRVVELGEYAARARLHFIGHLQRNKAPAVLEHCSTIHSVDSARLAQTISQRAVRPVRLLLEVNVAGEAAKYGFAPSEVASAVADIAAMPNLELAGLMTMAPVVSSAEETRPVFQELRRLAEANGLRELSMGMTDDFEVAIEEGATMVRLGRAIFQGGA
jgi:pyridoxal phosphate enzyme (YggS family)